MAPCELAYELTWPEAHPKDDFAFPLLLVRLGEELTLEFSAVRGSRSLKVVPQWRFEDEPWPSDLRRGMTNFASGMVGGKRYVNAARMGAERFPRARLEERLSERRGGGLDPLTAFLVAQEVEEQAQAAAQAILCYLQEWLAFGLLWEQEARVLASQARSFIETKNSEPAPLSF